MSASVVLLATALDADPNRDAQFRGADYAAETLDASTLSIQYSLRAVEDSPSFDRHKRAGGTYSGDAYTRVAHGSATHLLAEAALMNLQIDGRRLHAAGPAFERAVATGIQNQFIGTEVDARVVATWQPFNESTIEARATAGNRPPAGADVSTAVLTVSSEMPSVSERVEEGYRDGGFYGAARPMAEAIIQRYLLPSETQLALEQGGFQRAITVYRYRRMAALVAPSDSPLNDAVLGRTTAKAKTANKDLAIALAETLETRLRDQFGSDATAEQLGRATTVDHVKVIVKTW